MKTMMRHGCAAVLALAFAHAWADTAPVPVERHDTLTASVSSGTAVLASWSGYIPGLAVADTAAGSGAAARTASGGQVLSSWTGSIPGATRDPAGADAGRAAGAISHKGAQVLASWAGSIRGG
jgi:hypothetical protein